MKNTSKTSLLTALICAASLLNPGCAKADGKDAKKFDETIKWEAPGTPGSAADTQAAALAGQGRTAMIDDDIASVWEEMDRMQQAMLGSMAGWGTAGGWSRPTRASLYSMSASEMHADVAETDKEYIITCELPGVSKQDIKIDVDGSTLVVQAVRNAGTDRSGEEAGQRYHYRERSYGTTQRRFRIGSGVDPKKIKASLKDGVLTLRVPKGTQSTYQVPISD